MTASWSLRSCRRVKGSGRKPSGSGVYVDLPVVDFVALPHRLDRTRNGHVVVEQQPVDALESAVRRDRDEVAAGRG